MKINLVSNLDADSAYQHLQAYNHIIAWSLREALQEAGHEPMLVCDRLERDIPHADHTIIISNTAMNRIHDEGWYQAEYRRSATGLFCLWLDGAFDGSEDPYDRVLTVAPVPKWVSPKFKQVGWAADPERFRPEQTEPTAFVDTYMYGWYNGQFDKIYDLMKEALQESGIKTLQPTAQYNQGRIHWVDLQEIFRKSTYHIGTQLCHWGWTEIEAATCGSLLVFNRAIHRPDTWPSVLNHELWDTKEELIEILSRPVDVAANRARARENTWQKIVTRIEEALR